MGINHNNTDKIKGVAVAENRMRGFVKFYNYKKGYGFAEQDGVDYFIHITDVEGTDLLLQGEEVEFRPVQGEKGWQALEIRRVEPPVMEEQEGSVKFHDDSKGYGFIRREGKADVFVHYSDVEEGSVLEEGARVLFEVRKGRDGRDRAYKVRRSEE